MDMLESPSSLRIRSTTTLRSPVRSALAALLAVVVALMLTACRDGTINPTRQVKVVCPTCRLDFRFYRENIAPWDDDHERTEVSKQDCPTCLERFSVTRDVTWRCRYCKKVTSQYSEEVAPPEVVTQGEFLRRKEYYAEKYPPVTRESICGQCAEPITLEKVVVLSCANCQTAYDRKVLKTLTLPKWEYMENSREYDFEYWTRTDESGLCTKCRNLRLGSIDVWISDPAPRRRQLVTVYVKALDTNGRPLATVNVASTWRFKTTTIGFSALTDKNGIARHSYHIGGATRGYRVPVEVTASFRDDVATGSTGFTPR
ncbi:hypothetical protein FDZ71_00675 [bacterium]|nr:MAG: hypothetical protein FDZ71_00675 [bacterium]